MALKETPSQTAGPFVHIGTLPAVAGLKTKTPEQPNILARDGTLGERRSAPQCAKGLNQARKCHRRGQQPKIAGSEHTA